MLSTYSTISALNTTWTKMTRKAPMAKNAATAIWRFAVFFEVSNFLSLFFTGSSRKIVRAAARMTEAIIGIGVLHKGNFHVYDGLGSKKGPSKNGP